ncbi:hypothetical protein EB796_005936 [Bugula neritina]|uniref:Uncharacterized protein n=1 Tax=Bugula neritina TaxID=10212 RepID=A0A7J7KCT6_BUGNE|nr:hypothetical protein EB796_005936 [Bugula neritina]
MTVLDESHSTVKVSCISADDENEHSEMKNSSDDENDISRSIFGIENGEGESDGEGKESNVLDRLFGGSCETIGQQSDNNSDDSFHPWF